MKDDPTTQKIKDTDDIDGRIAEVLERYLQVLIAWSVDINININIKYSGTTLARSFRALL